MKRILEFKDYNHLTEDELFEMTNISQKTTGISDVIIWVGPHPKQHGMRIKVSNIPNSFDPSDCFVITIPDFQIIGNINTKLITSEKLQQIKEFITLNIDVISDYSNSKIGTEDLLEKIKKVGKK